MQIPSAMAIIPQIFYEVAAENRATITNMSMKGSLAEAAAISGSTFLLRVNRREAQ